MMIKERLKKFLEYKEITPTSMERLLGWGVGAFTKARSITSDRLSEILMYFKELSAEWVMRGDGSMIKGMESPREADKLNRLVDTIATLQVVINEKNEALMAAAERIRQLESQLG